MEGCGALAPAQCQGNSEVPLWETGLTDVCAMKGALFLLCWHSLSLVGTGSSLSGEISPSMLFNSQLRLPKATLRY